MPSVRITLKALNPKESDFEASTLGEHLRKRRLELKLSQKAAAKRLGISWRTVFNWEKGNSAPAVESIPALIRFLGYDPFPMPIGLSERLAVVRRAMVWTVKEAAQKVGVDSGTWGRWEKAGVPWKRHREMVEAFLKALSGSELRTCSPREGD